MEGTSVIPILQDHDQSLPPVGHVRLENGRLFVEFVSGVSFNRFFEIFGDAGMRVLQLSDGVEPMIEKAEILEFSLRKG